MPASVLAGVALKKFAREFSEGIEPFAPIVAVLTVALICSSIIGRSADKILAAGPTLIGAAALCTLSVSVSDISSLARPAFRPRRRVQ